MNSASQSLTLGRGGGICPPIYGQCINRLSPPDPDLHIFEVGPDVEDTFVDISKDNANWEQSAKYLAQRAVLTLILMDSPAATNSTSCAYVMTPTKVKHLAQPWVPTSTRWALFPQYPPQIRGVFLSLTYQDIPLESTVVERTLIGGIAANDTLTIDSKGDTDLEDPSFVDPLAFGPADSALDQEFVFDTSVRKITVEAGSPNPYADLILTNIQGLGSNPPWTYVTRRQRYEFFASQARQR